MDPKQEAESSSTLRREPPASAGTKIQQLQTNRLSTQSLFLSGSVRRKLTAAI
jgi:hypothetical protein